MRSVAGREPPNFLVFKNMHITNHELDKPSAIPTSIFSYNSRPTMNIRYNKMGGKTTFTDIFRNAVCSVQGLRGSGTPWSQNGRLYHDPHIHCLHFTGNQLPRILSVPKTSLTGMRRNFNANCREPLTHSILVNRECVSIYIRITFIN